MRDNGDDKIMYGKQIICLGIVVLVVALAGCIQTPSENGGSTDDSLSNVLKNGILTVGSPWNILMMKATS